MIWSHSNPFFIWPVLYEILNTSWFDKLAFLLNTLNFYRTKSFLEFIMLQMKNKSVEGKMGDFISLDPYSFSSNQGKKLSRLA